MVYIGMYIMYVYDYCSYIQGCIYLIIKVNCLNRHDSQNSFLCHYNIFEQWMPDYISLVNPTTTTIKGTSVCCFIAQVSNMIVLKYAIISYSNKIAYLLYDYAPGNVVTTLCAHIIYFVIHNYKPPPKIPVWGASEIVLYEYVFPTPSHEMAAIQVLFQLA